jgi:hypothetical protein
MADVSSSFRTPTTCKPAKMVQAEAYLDPSWLATKAGQAVPTREHLERVELLLASPFMPAAERERLRARMR